MIVFDIKRYAINDGPGIRTTIFTKGCPLRCIWCHNPESWLPEPEMLFKAKKCIGCNSCGWYPRQLEKIRDERLKIKNNHAQPSLISHLSSFICPTLALEMCGREWTVEELLAEVEKERDIMTDSGGGVTVSGGEPLLQVKRERGESLLHLLHELGQRGFHRAVDTTLYADPDVVQAVAAETDLFLVDLKVMDAGKHKLFTGVSNELILSNLRLIASLGVPFQVRIPLIEGINTDEENIEATAAFSASVGGQKVNLLPYHDAGKDKHARRGTTYNPKGLPMSTPAEDTLQRIISQFAAHGLSATIGG